MGRFNLLGGQLTCYLPLLQTCKKIYNKNKHIKENNSQKSKRVKSAITQVTNKEKREIQLH